MKINDKFIESNEDDSLNECSNDKMFCPSCGELTRKISSDEFECDNCDAIFRIVDEWY